MGMVEEECREVYKQEECTGGRVLWKFMLEFQEAELSSVGTISWKIRLILENTGGSPEGRDTYSAQVK